VGGREEEEEGEDDKNGKKSGYNELLEIDYYWSNCEVMRKKSIYFIMGMGWKFEIDIGCREQRAKFGCRQDSRTHPPICVGFERRLLA
jgi:hypothetical protein